jgi:hypothetical protein
MDHPHTRLNPTEFEFSNDSEHTRLLKLHGDKYHFNNYQRESPGETFRIIGKIIGDWSIDLHVANQRAVREIWGSREESPDIVYIAHLGPDTPDLNCVVDVFKFDRIVDARVDLQKPGACVTRHLDDFSKDTKPGEKIVRLIVMLEDWQAGQTLTFGNSVLTYWEKGQVIYSDFEKIPHATSNASWNPRSILIITGAVSQNTVQLLAYNFGEAHI